MKNIVAAALMASMTLATTAHAGSVVYEPAAAPVMVEEEAPMGSSGAWIIPILGLALICIVVCRGDDDNDPRGDLTDLVLTFEE